MGPMITSNTFTGTIIVAANSGTTNVVRVARALGMTRDDVWAAADAAWEARNYSASRTLSIAVARL